MGVSWLAKFGSYFGSLSPWCLAWQWGEKIQTDLCFVKESLRFLSLQSSHCLPGGVHCPLGTWSAGACWSLASAATVLGSVPGHVLLVSVEVEASAGCRGWSLAAQRLRLLSGVCDTIAVSWISISQSWCLCSNSRGYLCCGFYVKLNGCLSQLVFSSISAWLSLICLCVVASVM